ncbi:MAG: NUDIX hydrolase [Clostridia bacterium]|nr:NUDIX hydrolase [Clostridia bacterium]
MLSVQKGESEMLNKVEKLLSEKTFVEREKIDSFDCRFMGSVYTYDIIYTNQDFHYAKAYLSKPCGGSSILPIDKDGNVFLEIQYRFPIRQAILELPAGRVDENESYLECAKRELTEETGCVSQEIAEQIGFYAQPEFSDEWLASYSALNCKQTEKQHLDSDENVKVYPVPFEVALDLVKKGVIIDERTIIGLGICRCIQGLRFPEDLEKKEEYCRKIKEDIIEEGKRLEEVEVDIDYTEIFEFGIVQDHIVKIPGDKNSRRECFYVKAGELVIPVSKEGKIGLKIAYMPAVDKKLLQLPEKIEFAPESAFETFGEIVTAVGYANDRQALFVLEGLEESSDYLWFSEEEILTLIKEKKIEDGRVLAALLKYLI